MLTDDRLEMRRAVEAQRSGVPSAAAVRSMGCGQDRLADRYRKLLRDADAETPSGRQVPGMLVRGGFGEGKSHLLTAFEHIALDEGYAVTRIVISKETPLYVPAKMLASAVEGLRVPDTVSRGLAEVDLLLRKRFDTPEFQSLLSRLSSGPLNGRFYATLKIFRDGVSDEEVVDRILRFWSGGAIAVGEMKRLMRELEIADARLDPIRARDLALQTMAFLPLLLRAADLRGLVLLIDELELIGRYGKVGRGQAYAELARWMGVLEEDPRPGLVTVGAITSDYEQAVLFDKGDLDAMGAYMKTRPIDLSRECERGMQCIREAELLAAPDQALLEKSYRTLQQLHGHAYQWSPGDVAWPEALGSTPMRKYVRAWINAWDVQRLYGERVDAQGYEMDTIRTDYGETPELVEPEGDGMPDGNGATNPPEPDIDAWQQ